MRRGNPEKSRQTKTARAAEYAKQVIPITDNLFIARFDELNWEIQFNGESLGYYGTLVDAFRALSAKMLNQGEKNSIADVLRHQKAIQTSIETALRLKLA